MSSCTIIKPGLFTTLQDQGRKGLAYYAIPQSGAMDRTAADQANILAGNELNSAVIEATMIGPTILFNSRSTIALTGANMQWKINDQAVNQNCSLKIHEGDKLRGGPAKGGMRSYIAIRGKILAQENFGSCSAYSYARLGHNEGQALGKGDELLWEPIEGKALEITMNGRPLVTSIRIFPGPEFSLLSDKSKEQLTTEEFIITPVSNRMGARLKGPQLELNSGLSKSVAVLPGFIQLPPQGQPIVVLQDGQTTGGYPRIAYLRQKELSLLNQLPFNLPFKFFF